MPSVAEVRRVLGQLRSTVQQADETYVTNFSDVVQTDELRNDPNATKVSMFQWSFKLVKEQHRKRKTT